MREILFRGKRIDNGEWVEGYFCNENCDGIAMPMYEQANIIKKGTGFWHPVNPKTVGQYAGITDRRGRRIFEGDIFEDRREDMYALVVFKNGCFCLEWYGITGAYTESGFDECGGGWGLVECEPFSMYHIRDFTVIGNIHETPELSKEAAGNGKA